MQHNDIQGVTKKKLDCFNNALGTMPIGKPLGHCNTQLLSYVVLHFFLQQVISFLSYKLSCNIV